MTITTERQQMGHQITLTLTHISKQTAVQTTQQAQVTTVIRTP